MKAWIVKSFQDTFENAASRKIEEPNYLGLPLAQDSDRFLELMGTAHGAMAFGHFIAVVQVLGRLGRQARQAGAFISSGRALGPDQLAKRIGVPPKLLRKSWDLLASERIGWLKEMALPTELFAGVPNPSPVDSEPQSDRAGWCSELRQEVSKKVNTTPSPQGGAVGGGSGFPGFDRFWSAWPSHRRKEDKPACLRKWRKLGLELLADVVIDGLEAWKRSPDWTKDDGQFISAPHPWLNKRRWEQAWALKPASGGFPDLSPEETVARLRAEGMTP